MGIERFGSEITVLCEVCIIVKGSGFGCVNPDHEECDSL